MKLVSVIIPIYGVESYITDTIQSVLAQSYSNFELILVDDGSCDRSVERCQRFSDPRITLIHQANRGLAGARNTGIRHAHGEYLAFLDGDDLWHPHKLENHIQHLESSPAVGVSFSRSALIDDAGHPLNTYLMPRLEGIDLPYWFRENPIGNGSAAVLRRAVMDAIGFQDNLYGQVETFYFDDRFRRAEDIECWLRIAIQTPWEFAGLPEALTFYRVNASGLSASLHQQLAAWEQVLAKVRTYAPDVVDRWGTVGMAYRLRYLARTAIRLKAGATAVEFIHRALATAPQHLLTEPRRTGSILVGAYLLWLLPSAWYSRIESQAAAIAGWRQQRRIRQEHLPVSTGAKRSFLSPF